MGDRLGIANVPESLHRVHGNPSQWRERIRGGAAGARAWSRAATRRPPATVPARGAAAFLRLQWTAATTLLSLVPVTAEEFLVVLGIMAIALFSQTARFFRQLV